METTPVLQQTLLSTVIDTLIDSVSHTPIVFDEALLPDVLKSLADSVETSTMMPLLIRLMSDGTSQDEIQFELMGCDEVDDTPLIYTYSLSRTISQGRTIYVLRLLNEA